MIKWSPGRERNLEPPEYESTLLSTRFHRFLNVTDGVLDKTDAFSYELKA